jgi:hypothetical protein
MRCAFWRATAGVGVEELGLTTARPMYHPVPLKLLAGRSFNPERRTPVDAQHAALGAVWMPAGNWRRPEYYAVSGESRAQSIDAEVHAVRTASDSSMWARSAKSRSMGRMRRSFWTGSMPGATRI